MTTLITAAPQVSGLDHTTQNLLDQAWMQWSRKLPRNLERLMYLDGKNKLKDLRVAIPPQLADSLNVVMGWADKAVTEPVNRTVWDGMLSTDGDTDPLGLGGLLHGNNFRSELRQGFRASAAYSCSFVSSTLGDVQSGQPEVVTMFHSALHATGLWDRVTRSLIAGMLINDVDEMGRPTMLTLMLPHETLVCVKGASWYLRDKIPNPARRVTLELLPWVPEIDRPFGRARIDRRVMSIVDRAVRAGSRLDVHSEMFSAIKLLLMGVDQSAFQDESGKTVPLWDWYMGRFNVVSKDEDGDIPKLEKVSAESPEPHIATMRQLASEFSGHTGVPLGSLGIAQDNPESADAKNVAREDIIFMVEAQHEVFGHALRRNFENMVMLRDRLDAPPEEARAMELVWRRPDRASQAAQADAGAKQVQSAGLEGTKVGMRMLGMSDSQVTQAMTELSRTSATDLLLTRQADQPAGGEVSAATEEANVLKAKFDALGIAVRAGVDPDAAAKLLGLVGLKFTGAMPVALRMPKEEAAQLEEM